MSDITRSVRPVGNSAQTRFQGLRMSRGNNSRKRELNLVCFTLLALIIISRSLIFEILARQYFALSLALPFKTLRILLLMLLFIINIHIIIIVIISIFIISLVIIVGPWSSGLRMGSLIWEAWYCMGPCNGGPGVVRNVPNPLKFRVFKFREDFYSWVAFFSSSWKTRN